MNLVLNLQEQRHAERFLEAEAKMFKFQLIWTNFQYLNNY